MATVASLVVDLTANTATFQRNIKKSTQSLSTFTKVTKTVEEGLKRVKQVATGAGIIYTALSVAISKNINAAADFCDEIDKMSIRTQIAREELQEWRYVAGQVGVEFESIRTSVARFTRNLVENYGKANELGRAISKLGIRAKDSNGQFRNMSDLFTETIDSLASMTNETERNAIAMQLLGRSADELIPIFNEGGNGINYLRKQARDLGIVLSENTIVNFTRFGDEMYDIKERIRATATEIAEHFLPAGRQLMSWAHSIVDRFQGLSYEQKQNIAKWVLLTTTILGLVTAMGVVAAGISLFIKGLTFLGALVGVITSPFLLALTLIVLGITALATAWDENWGGIQEKTKVVTDFILEKWDKLTTWWETSNFGQTVRDAWADIEEVWQSDELTLGQKVIKTVSIVAETVADLVPSIRKIWDLWTDDDLSLGEKVLGTVKIVADSVSGLIESIITWWINTTVTLTEKVVKLLGLNPEENVFLDFMKNLQTIWNDETLTLGEKMVESIKLVPGGKVLSDLILDIQGIWANETLTLPEKIVGTVDLVVESISGVIESIGTWWASKQVILAEKAAELLGLDPGETWFVDLAKRIDGIWQREDLILSDKLIETINLIPIVGPVIEVVIKVTGDMYENIKTGLTTGDWGPFWGVASDVWTDGVMLGLMLSGVTGAGTIKAAIVAGLGLIAATGLPGALGLISVGIQLMEAKTNGEDFETFGLNLISALAAGIGIGMFTGSPYTGALAFTIVLNFKIGTVLDTLLGGVADAIQNNFPGYEIDIPEVHQPSSIKSKHQQQLEQYQKFAELLHTPTLSTQETSAVDTKTLDDLLDAIYTAEGGADARVPYGATGFYDAGHKFALDKNMERFEEIAEGLEVESEEYYRAAALTTILHYWDTFQEKFPEVAGQTFEALAPEVQKQFIEHLGQYYAPVGDHPLNTNWIPNVLNLMGFSSGGYTGNIPTDEIAGVVHGQELVVPATAVNKGLAGILDWLGVPGFQTGTPIHIEGLAEAQSTITGMQSMFEGLSSAILSGIATLFDIIATGLEVLATALLGEEKVEELKQRFADVRQGLTDFIDKLFPAQETLEQVDKAAPDSEVPTLWEKFKAKLSEVNELLGITTHAQQFYNSILQQLNPVARFFSALLSELGPAFTALMTPIIIVAEIFGEMLTPVLKMLFPVFKAVAIAASFVAEIFERARGAILSSVGGLVYGLGRALRHIWRIVGIELVENLENLGKSMLDSAEEAFGHAQQLKEDRSRIAALQWDDLIKSVDNATEAMRNVPQGLKIIQHRIAAASDNIPGVQKVANQTTAPQSEKSIIIQVPINGDIYGVDDLDKRVENNVGKAIRKYGLAVHGV